MSTFFSLVIALLVIALVIVMAAVRICNQYQRAVVFFLGRYSRTAGPGLYLLIPFLEWRTTVDVRTTTTAVEQQEAITKDNVPVKINAVIWRRVVDPKRSLIEVAYVEDAVTQAAVSCLRATIGRHTLDDVLKDQDSVAAQLQQTLDGITEPWGVKVEQVQMKNIEIPATMQRAMAQEAEALREKRSRQIKAEAELDAASLLKQAADIISASPASLELRRMQMLTEVGAEQNTMTIVMMPSEFVNLASALAASIGAKR
jgi:regulator of protease activity HflC (stomatin/prohibitin superfamily)